MEKIIGRLPKLYIVSYNILKTKLIILPFDTFFRILFKRNSFVIVKSLTMPQEITLSSVH